MFRVVDSDVRDTALFASKEKLRLFDRSWPGGVDHGHVHQPTSAIAIAVEPSPRQRRRDAAFSRFGVRDVDQSVLREVRVHGHTVEDAPITRVNRIGIDTGAYASGRLTALGLEREERWFLST